MEGIAWMRREINRKIPWNWIPVVPERWTFSNYEREEMFFSDLFLCVIAENNTYILLPTRIYSFLFIQMI